MKTISAAGSWAAAALLVLAGGISACGTEGEPSTPETTTTKSGDLLQNVAYVPWQMLVAKSGTSGDATLFGRKAYFAYVRPDSTIGIVYDSNTGTNGQSPATYAIPQTVDFGVALLSLNQTLYLFYSQNGQPVQQRSTDGLTWDGPSEMDSVEGLWGVGGPPAAASWNGYPVVFFPEPNRFAPTRIVEFDAGPNGKFLSAYPGPTAYTTSRPSATVWNGGLYLAWSDSQFGGQIGISHYLGSGNWSAETLTGKTGVPGIMQNGVGELEMVYKGTDSYIYRTFSSNGVTFGPTWKDGSSTTPQAPIPFEWYGSADWVFYIGMNGGLYTHIE